MLFRSEPLFGMAVTPGIKSGSDYNTGKYSDQWYIYADKEEFAELFEEMKAYKREGKKVAVRLVCVIDPDYYSVKQSAATLRYCDFDVKKGYILTMDR